MTEWTDEAIVLGSRALGETGLVLEVLTRDHGRFGAYVAGGISARMRPTLQPGNQITLSFRSRVSEQLGRFAEIELVEGYAGRVLGDPIALEAIAAGVALVRLGVGERSPHPEVYSGLRVVLAALDQEIWPAVYARFELGLLQGIGYGLDLSACALTGAREGLAFVSPKTGRAASAEAGAPFADRLLRLPPFVTDAGAPLIAGDVADALALAGHFLERRVFDPAGVGMPPARRRLIERLGMAGRL